MAKANCDNAAADTPHAGLRNRALPAAEDISVRSPRTFHGKGDAPGGWSVASRVVFWPA
jgi:hypothetical protein